MVTPEISVIMAVYNGEEYLRQAIDSILHQTFTNFEFVIVNDGSTDDTASILASYTDGRIKIVDQPQNLGLTRSLNHAIRESRGKYLARQDADDLAMPQRLLVQKRYLDAVPGVALVGAGSRWIDVEGNLLRDWQPMTDPVAIQKTMLAEIPLLHGTCMYRRSCLDALGGGYDESVTVAQDCDMMFRLTDRYEMANVRDVLYIYRQHQATTTSRRRAEQLRNLQRSRDATIARRLAFGWARVRGQADRMPEWVRAGDRRWLAQRYVWWSAAARMVNRKYAAQFLLISLLLDPSSEDTRAYLGGIVRRKFRVLFSARRAAATRP